MLVGFYFDWFLLYCVGLIWAAALARRPGASPWSGRWPWIVGVLYGLSWLGALAGMMQALDAPPPIMGQVNAAPPGASLVETSRLATRLIVLGGYVWLVLLTAQGLIGSSEPEEKADGG